jgi:hypothetical protein
MMVYVKRKRSWLLIGLCLTLLCTLGPDVVEAKKNKADAK